MNEAEKHPRLKRGVLVTGSHRSGSTWLGRTLCLANNFGYIHEPFNPLTRPGICRARFSYWFTHVCRENGHLYEAALEETLQFRYHPLTEIKSFRRPKDVGRMVRDWFSMERNRRTHRLPLVKDPIAFFSTPWFADRFNLHVVLLARHPAAFIASLKRAGWTHPFSHFVQQPTLLEELEPYQGEIERFAREPQDPIAQGILLWNLVHSKMNEWRRTGQGSARQADWVMVRHEDLSLNPAEEIPALARRLGGAWDASSDTRLRALTQGGQGESTPHNTHRLKRESALLVRSWQKTLDRREVVRIREGTQDVARHFYSEDSWESP